MDEALAWLQPHRKRGRHALEQLIAAMKDTP
jgi:hypothetical protein